MTAHHPHDHWLLARRYPPAIERARCALTMAYQGRGARVLQIAVAHDDDGRCCELEPWPLTLVALLALLPRHPAPCRAPAPPSPTDETTNRDPIA